MKNVFLILLLFFMWPAPALSEQGIVVQEDVCGFGNVVIQLGNEMYVTAEYYSGVYLSKWDVVRGNLVDYGLTKLTRSDQESGEFFVQPSHSYHISDAVRTLCR